MVSIIAETVYSETFTESFADGNNLATEISNMQPPLTDVSGVLGGFAYVETVTTEVNAIQNIDVVGSAASNYSSRDDYEVTPQFVFDQNLNLFNTLSPLKFFGTGTIGGGDIEALNIDNESVTHTADTYIDTPAEMTAVFSADVTSFGGGSRIKVDGNQTIDFELDISIIGRKP